MKKPVIIFMILLLSFVSGCANSYDNGSYISDPFSNSFTEPKDDSNPTRDELFSLSEGGYSCEVNGGEPVEYNGEPIILPVKVTASDDCKADMSIGIMCCINGSLQRLSSENDKDKAMIIKTGIAPGKTLEFDITFTPEILLEDADKKQLPITFLSAFNPTFKASEEYVGFGYTHDIQWVPSKYIEFNSNPSTFSANKYNLYDENIVLDDEGGKTRYLQNNSSTSTLKINENNTIDFTAYLENCKAGEYVGYVLKNNEITKINNGQDCVEITIKKSRCYNIDIRVEDIKKGDVIHCFFAKKESNEPLDLIKFGPILVVNSDFTVSIPETEESSVSDDTNPSLPAETSPSAAENPGGIPGSPLDSPAAHCIPYGYIGENPRLVVGDSGDLVVCDSESGKLLNSLRITYYEETDDGYIRTDWSMLQVLKDYICVPKLIIKNGAFEAVFEGMSIYDKELNFVKDIAVIADCLTYDGQSKIKFMFDNYLDDGLETFYISDIESDDIRSRRLCQIPKQYELVRSYFVTDENFLYGMLKESGQNSKQAYAYALDISTGELIINTNKHIYSECGAILPTESCTLYTTGDYNPKSSDGGTLVYFDKKNRCFKEIQTLSINECLFAGITPDGSKIVTCASVFRTINEPNDISVRVYSTADGSLLASQEAVSCRYPICTNEGFIIADGEKAKKITFAEMGLS